MSSDERQSRVIALYLPQYHPIPENDEWWGRGFTEWINSAKAKPMFRGHYQPHIPTDLGFYDLRVPQTRLAQAEMAKQYGIEAFCYYHYWFAGRRLLEKPFSEVLESGEPDFPFCLCWANQSWTGIWHGASDRVLVEQTYPGDNDHREHFKCLLRAFGDRRYITIDGKPIFLIYQPLEIPSVKTVTQLWREMAKQSGLKGIYLIGFSWDENWVPEEYGFDASLIQRLPFRRELVCKGRPIERLIGKYRATMGKPTIYSYKKILPILLANGITRYRAYPCLIPNWDNTPRSGNRGIVFHGSTPELFRVLIKRAVDIVKPFPAEERLIFIKSWNEWAEGNHLEPDLKFGRAYLEVIKDEILKRGQLVG